MKSVRCSLAVALVVGSVAVLVPVVLAPSAGAAPATVSGELDYDDQSGGSIGDYDLGYSITVSNTTPQVGDNVTVTINWDENGADPWGYSDVNLCWDAPPGWAGAGGPPATQDYSVTTAENTPVSGQVVGTDVPQVPVATSNFFDSSAIGERTDVTSYETPAGRVYRFCAHVDRIDERGLGIFDALDSIHGTMTITLEAPRSGPVSFGPLLPTSSYVGDATFHGGVARRFPAPLDNRGYGLPADPAYEALVPPRSPGSLSQTTGGSMGVVRYDYDGDGSDNASPAITVNPVGTLISYALHEPPAQGLATVNPDGTWSYLPASGYIGPDSFKVRISDGDATSLSTVSVQVTEGTTAMTVTKSAAQTEVIVGEPIDYEIVVAATGTKPLLDVEVVDPNAPDCDRTIDRVSQGTSTAIECSYTPVAGDVGTYTNVATASVAELADPVDSNPVEVTVAEAATPRLQVQAMTTQTSVEAGGAITYEVEVTNTGGVPLTGVAVTAPDAPGCARAVGSLAVGARSVWTCTLVTTPAMVGDRSAVVTADSDQTAPVDAEPVVVEVTAADGSADVGYTCPGVPVQGTVQTAIAVAGEDDLDPAEPGRPVQWTLRVANPSIGTVPIAITIDWLEVEFPRPANLTDVSLALLNPPGQTANPPNGQATTTINANVVRFRTPANGDIALGTNGALTYNGAPVVLPQLRITGTPTEAARGTDVRWRAPTVRINVSTLGTGTITCTPTLTTVASTRVAPANPILDVDKSSVQQAAMPGQTVTYELVVRNRGNVALTGVVVDDPIAPDCDRSVGTLAAGAQQTYTCTRAVTEADVGRLRNVATADSDQTPPVTSNPADVVVGTEAVPALGLELTAASPAVVAGEDATWTVDLANTGNAELTGLSLDAADDSDCETATVPPTLAVGATAQVVCATPTAGRLAPFDRRGVVANAVTVTTVETGAVASGPVNVDVTIPPTGWSDVAAWYADAADWLDFWDLATGFGNGTFRGTAPITRAELVRMVHRLQASPAPPSPPTHGFADVPRWVADEVAWAAHDPDGDGPELALVTGLTPERFGPRAAITRAQTVRLLYRLALRQGPRTVPDPPTHIMGDVPRWVTDAVAWAAQDPDGEGPLAPLVTGLTPTRFGPDAPVTRAQVARMLYRLAEVLDL